MICVKCGGYFPSSMTIDGKQRWLTKRRYCLSCSPFGCHNTKQLHVTYTKRSCSACKKIFKKSIGSGFRCQSCVQKNKKAIRKDVLLSIVGKSCWICGYSKCVSALDFHHVYPKDKKIPLSNSVRYALDDVLEEIKKCVLVCCRCHREHHAGIISDEDVKIIHKEKWEDISNVQRRRAEDSAGV